MIFVMLLLPLHYLAGVPIMMVALLLHQQIRRTEVHAQLLHQQQTQHGIALQEPVLMLQQAYAGPRTTLKYSFIQVLAVLCPVLLEMMMIAQCNRKLHLLPPMAQRIIYWWPDIRPTLVLIRLL
jgi:hypothetical protein